MAMAIIVARVGLVDLRQGRVATADSDYNIPWAYTRAFCLIVSSHLNVVTGLRPIRTQWRKVSRWNAVLSLGFGSER